MSDYIARYLRPSALGSVLARDSAILVHQGYRGVSGNGAFGALIYKTAGTPQARPDPPEPTNHIPSTDLEVGTHISGQFPETSVKLPSYKACYILYPAE